MLWESSTTSRLVGPRRRNADGKHVAVLDTLKRVDGVFMSSSHHQRSRRSLHTCTALCGYEVALIFTRARATNDIDLDMLWGNPNPDNSTWALLALK